jgi:hypothetical protein
MGFGLNIDQDERSAVAEVFLDVDPDLKPIHQFYLRRRLSWISDIERLQKIEYTIRAKDPNELQFKDAKLGFSLRTIEQLYSKTVSTDEELATIYLQQKLSRKLSLSVLAELLVLHLLMPLPISPCR